LHPRLLKTFLAVARSRNVTHAAKEVHLAQSSVSDQIQSLEAELRTSLFARSRSGLRLTPAGETLKSYAQDILALADEGRAAVQATAGQMAGSVTIGRAGDDRVEEAAALGELPPTIRILSSPLLPFAMSRIPSSCRGARHGRPVKATETEETDSTIGGSDGASPLPWRES